MGEEKVRREWEEAWGLGEGSGALDSPYFIYMKCKRLESALP